MIFLELVTGSINSYRKGTDPRFGLMHFMNVGRGQAAPRPQCTPQPAPPTSPLGNFLAAAASPHFGGFFFFFFKPWGFPLHLPPKNLSFSFMMLNMLFEMFKNIESYS